MPLNQGRGKWHREQLDPDSPAMPLMRVQKVRREEKLRRVHGVPCHDLCKRVIGASEVASDLSKAQR